MAGYLGDFTTSNTVYILFNTYDSNDPAASVTLTGLAVTDIEIYKNGSTTQRASDAGYTLLDTDGIDFDGITGIHGFSIDLSDNTDAGFFAAGNEYTVVVSSVTVDAGVINFVAGSFSIERAGGALALIKDGTSGLAKIATDTAAVLVDTGTTLDGKIDTIDGIVDSILVDTAEIGVAGAGLTNINLPNQTMDIVGNITGNLSGSVGSVTGAVGSVTGSVGSVVGHTAQTGDTYAVLASGIASETRNNTLIERLKQIESIIESQRGAHTAQFGNVLYVDPVNGNTHASGNRGGITDPYSLVQDCHDNAVTDSNHDLIILLSGAAAGPTTLTEDVTLSKRYLFIRGPGRDFIWTRSGPGDTITVTADGVEISGCQVNTAATGSGNGITVTSADFFRAYCLWFNDTQGDAIQLTDCDNFVIDKCVLQGSGQSGSGHGIQVLAGAGQTSNYGAIRHCYIHDVAGDGIQLDTTGGGTTDSTMIHDNIIEGCTDDGVDVVDSGCVGVVIHGNTFGNNASNDIEDAGTNTVIINNEQWAKHSIATETRLAELDAANLPADVDTLLGRVVGTLATGTHNPQSGDTYALANGATGFAAINTDVELILADTNELQTDWVDGGRLDLLLDGAASAADPWTTALPGGYGAGTAGEIIGDWYNGERLDLILDAIKGKTDLLGSGTVALRAPVSSTGLLEDIIIGDDYLAVNEHDLAWTFNEITGFTTSATGKFGLKDALTGLEVYVNSAGVVTDLGYGIWEVSFDILKTALTALTPGKYDWSVEITEVGVEYTIAYNVQDKSRVRLVAKQT